MKAQYKTAISDARWIAYDIPGNVGWIAYLVCVFRGLREKRDACRHSTERTIESNAWMVPVKTCPFQLSSPAHPLMFACLGGLWCFPAKEVYGNVPEVRILPQTFYYFK